MTYQMGERIKAYLDGNLNAALKFPDKLQNVYDESDEKEDSDWKDRELNHYTRVRRDVARSGCRPRGLSRRHPAPENFSGASSTNVLSASLMRFWSRRSLTRYERREYAPTGAASLNGRLQREDHEHTMTQVTKACLKKITHHGVNNLVKHAGCILRSAVPRCP
jgi:hypothetical protein